MTHRDRAMPWGFWWRRGALALVLGVITTVGVAWGASAWASRARAKGVDSSGVMALGTIKASGPVFKRGFGLITGFLVAHGIASTRVWWVASTMAYGHGMPEPTVRSLTEDPDSAGLLVQGSARVALPPSWAVRSSQRMYTQALEEWSSGSPGWPELLPSNAFAERYGWPLRAFEVHGTTHAGGPVHVRAGILLSEDQRGRGSPATSIILPLGVVWGGLALDTLAFGAAWLVVLLAAGAGRRVWRRRHGRCTACGYDLGGALSGGCPECGWGRERESGERKAESGKQG